MKKTTIIETITILYIILFCYTGISKIIDHEIFEQQVAVSPLLAPVSKLITIAVPLAEFVLILLLIIPKWRLKGFWGSLVLMTLFTIYIMGILILNDKLPCSCGGVIELLSWTQHIIFNSIFISLSVIGIILEKKLKMSANNSNAIIQFI